MSQLGPRRHCTGIQYRNDVVLARKIKSTELAALPCDTRTVNSGRVTNKRENPHIDVELTLLLAAETIRTPTDSICPWKKPMRVENCFLS
jgi:hypothetical protein